MWDASSELKEYLPHSFFREAYARQNEEISQKHRKGEGGNFQSEKNFADFVYYERKF